MFQALFKRVRSLLTKGLVTAHLPGMPTGEGTPG
jgi:hypothetical protein